MSYKILPTLFSAALLALGGCDTFDTSERSKKIETTLSTYGEAIRWGYFETAHSHIHPEKRKEFPAYLEKIRVTGYDVQESPRVKDNEEAVQLVRIEYVHDDVQIVRVLKDRQRWRYDEATKKWWLESGLPDFE